jgi:hypothetical protein
MVEFKLTEPQEATTGRRRAARVMRSLLINDLLEHNLLRVHHPGSPQKLIFLPSQAALVSESGLLHVWFNDPHALSHHCSVSSLFAFISFH